MSACFSMLSAHRDRFETTAKRRVRSRTHIFASPDDYVFFCYISPLLWVITDKDLRRSLMYTNPSSSTSATSPVSSQPSLSTAFFVASALISFARYLCTGEDADTNRRHCNTASSLEDRGPVTSRSFLKGVLSRKMGRRCGCHIQGQVGPWRYVSS